MDFTTGNKARCDSRPFGVRAWCGQHLFLCKPRLTAEQHYDEEAIIHSGCYTFSLKSPCACSFSQGKGKRWKCVLAPHNLNVKCSNTSLGAQLPSLVDTDVGLQCITFNLVIVILSEKTMRIQAETHCYTKNTHFILQLRKQKYLHWNAQYYYFWYENCSSGWRNASYPCCSWYQSAVSSSRMVHCRWGTIHTGRMTWMMAAAAQRSKTQRPPVFYRRGRSPCGRRRGGAAEPGCQWLLRPRRKSLSCGETMSCSHCSAAPPGRTANTGRLGVGARCEKRDHSDAPQ